MDQQTTKLVEKGEMLPLMEAFYTIQGEGHHSGKSAYFLRIGGCDVGCHWCDVKESWDAELHPPTRNSGSNRRGAFNVEHATPNGFTAPKWFAGTHRNLWCLSLKRFFRLDLFVAQKDHAPQKRPLGACQ
jgi:pyruvate-formate lyase-activating enzyme